MDHISKMSKMGWPYFLQSDMDNITVNGSEAGFPSGVVDSLLLTVGKTSPLLQLFLVAYRFIGTQFGLDPSMLLTMLGLAWGLSKLFTQVYAIIQSYVVRYMMCAMYVREQDHIYSQLMKFLSMQQSVSVNRNLMAETIWKSAWEEEEELENSLLLTDGGESDEEPKYLNFSSQAARSVGRFFFIFLVMINNELYLADPSRVLDTSLPWGPQAFGTMVPTFGLTERGNRS